MSSIYDPPDEAAVLRLVREFPLAWVVSGGGGAFSATPLPMLAECDAGGKLVSLLGHFSRANPQVAALAAAPDAVILFQGPQGYLSPGLVADPTWAPTWNFAVARFQVRISFAPDETDAAVRRLTAEMEVSVGGDWSVEKMGPRYAAMLPRIVAFRAHVLARHATFKLGQDEGADHFRTIVDGLDDARLASWMRDAATATEAPAPTPPPSAGHEDGMSKP